MKTSSTAATPHAKLIVPLVATALVLMAVFVPVAPSTPGESHHPPSNFASQSPSRLRSPRSMPLTFSSHALRIESCAVAHPASDGRSGWRSGDRRPCLVLQRWGLDLTHPACGWVIADQPCSIIFRVSIAFL